MKNERVITLEYNEEWKTERKVVKNRKTGRTEHKTIQMKDPKCWQVITAENTMFVQPGERLPVGKVKNLMRNHTVKIGMVGQYRTNHRGY